MDRGIIQKYRRLSLEQLPAQGPVGQIENGPHLGLEPEFRQRGLLEWLADQWLVLDPGRRPGLSLVPSALPGPRLQPALCRSLGRPAKKRPGNRETPRARGRTGGVAQRGAGQELSEMAHSGHQGLAELVYRQNLPGRNQLDEAMDRG